MTFVRTFRELLYAEAPKTISGPIDSNKNEIIRRQRIFILLKKIPPDLENSSEIFSVYFVYNWLRDKSLLPDTFPFLFINITSPPVYPTDNLSAISPVKLILCEDETTEDAVLNILKYTLLIPRKMQ